MRYLLSDRVPFAAAMPMRNLWWRRIGAARRLGGRLLTFQVTFGNVLHTASGKGCSLHASCCCAVGGDFPNECFDMGCQRRKINVATRGVSWRSRRHDATGLRIGATTWWAAFVLWRGGVEVDRTVMCDGEVVGNGSLGPPYDLLLRSGRRFSEWVFWGGVPTAENQQIL